MNIQLEKQVIKPFVSTVNKISQIKPRIGQGRAGLRLKKPHISQLIVQSVKHLQKTPEVSKIQMQVINIPNFTAHVQSISNPSTEVINRRMMQKISKDIPFYPDPVYRPPPKPVKIPVPEFLGYMDINPELNINFKENSAVQEDVILETYQRPDKSFFQEPQELESLINTGRLLQEFLPKQADIDKILKVIQRKVLKGTHLPAIVKEIQPGYLVGPYFKDIYLYLAQNKLPCTKTAI